MGQDPTITLSIKEAGERPNSTYLFHIHLDGKVITSNQSLSLPDSRSVREISRSFGALFEPGCRSGMDADAQRALGKQLFDLWLAPSWEKITAAVPVSSLRFLVIASDIPEILNLPWELLLPPEGEFLGINPLFKIRRFPSTGRQMATFAGELRPGPLRLLFMACSPTNLATLDYEKEEEALFRAIYGQDVAFDSCDLGTFEELKEKVSEFKPHIVHLTGHGAVLEGQGRFAFEKEDGTADLVPAGELRRFLSGSGVQCVFVSGCQSGKAPMQVLSGICQSLVGAEVPLAVGWAASIADDMATNFARTFYKTLKDGQPVDRALLLARQEAWKTCEKQGDPSWTLPVLYSATSQNHIFDPNKPSEVLNRQNNLLDALPGMKEGYAEHFVGRRREQQRLLPKLRSGDLHVVIITGLGGSGKSTLATRLARRLETSGFIPIPVPSSKENPLNSARLLQAFGDAFRNAARKIRRDNSSKADELAALAEDLNNPKLSVQSRLHDAVFALNEGHFLLLLDNFESNLDEEDRHILDTEISGFYRYLLESLSGGSRAIVTTRYPPSDVPVLPLKAHREDLGDFPESSFLKIMQRDSVVERRIRSGELPMALLRELHKKFGGTPRFLLQIREAIKDMDAELLKAELARVELPSEMEQGALRKLQDEYFGDIFTERLYSYLSPESQKALCRSAVYGVPVTLEGMAAVAGEPLDDVRAFAGSWQDRAFAYRETTKSAVTLWVVFGLLRSWLQSRLSKLERTAANGAAGDFLHRMIIEKRTEEIGLSWIDCVLEALAHFIQSSDYEHSRIVIQPLTIAFMSSGFYEEAKELNSKLLEYEEHPLPMSWIIRALFEQGNYSEVHKWVQRIQTLIKSDADPELATFPLYVQAHIDLRKGDWKGAREKFSEALQISQKIVDKEGKAKTDIVLLIGLATIDFGLGNYYEAGNSYLKALELCCEIDDKIKVGPILKGLACVDFKKGNYAQSKAYFMKALDNCRTFDSKPEEASIFYELGKMTASRGQIKEGLRLIALACLIFKSVGHAMFNEANEHFFNLIQKNRCDKDKIKSLIEDVQEIHGRDHGVDLIDAAFPKLDPDASSH